MNYSYLADGTKLSALDDDGGGLLYRGSLIYRKTDGEIALESILFEGGRFVPNGGPMLHVTDHLGSVRAVVNALSGEVTETSDYFPFGMRMDIWGAVEDESNRYRFNGKEDQEGEFGVPTLDYGARHYSATSARWLSMDPLAEKYYSVSPYAFCNNNPVIYVDLDGRRWVNSFGQVIYDKNGLSANASMEEIELVKAMLQTRTGTKQLDKIACSPVDVVVIIDNNEVPKKGYGHNKIIGVKYNTLTGKYYPSRECEIAIYKKKAENRSYLLETYEAMAVNFAHEIEHTTSDNIKLVLEESSEEAIEKYPNLISQNMISEFYITKPLDNLDALYRLIEEKLQEKANIQINFK